VLLSNLFRYSSLNQSLFHNIMQWQCFLNNVFFHHSWFSLLAMSFFILKVFLSFLTDQLHAHLHGSAMLWCSCPLLDQRTEWQCFLLGSPSLHAVSEGMPFGSGLSCSRDDCLFIDHSHILYHRRRHCEGGLLSSKTK